MLAVGRGQEEKLAVEGIAECEAVRLRETSDRIKKDFLPVAGVLQLPSFTAVGCFVDAGLFTFAAGYHVSNGGVKSNDAAEIKRVASHDVQALPRFACVDRAKNYAVRAGRPNHRCTPAFCARHVDGAHAAKIRIKAAGLNFPILRLRCKSEKQEEKKYTHGAHSKRGTNGCKLNV